MQKHFEIEKKKPVYDVLFTKAFALFVLVQSCFL